MRLWIWNSSRVTKYSIQIQWDELFQTTSMQLNLNTISHVHLRVFTIVLSWILAKWYFTVLQLWLSPLQCALNRQLTWHLSTAEVGPKMAVFGNKRDEVLNFLSSNPKKAHPYVEPRHLTYCAWKLIRRPRLWGVGRTQKESSRVNIFDVQFRAYVEK